MNKRTYCIFLVLELALLCAATAFRRPHRRTADDCKFSICENAPQYPDDEIRAIVDQHTGFHSFFKEEVFKTTTQGISISTRQMDSLKTFCKNRDVTAAPKLMRDIQNIARTVVNVGKYTQVLNYQVCDFEEGGQECFRQQLLEYQTKCTQKFSNIKLVTVNVSNSVLEYRTFKIPTTCVCTYVKNSI